MSVREPISVGEWYHCFSRGMEKHRVFEVAMDYERFLIQLLVGNRKERIHVSNLKQKSFEEISDMRLSMEEPLVEIGAYALMPNHFHLLLRESTEGGIARFMQKVMTGYTMYFNISRSRTGALFSGTYKSKHVHDDRYLKHVISYIHLNPAELRDARWKSGKADMHDIEAFLATYKYSSLCAYKDSGRPERKILSENIFDHFDASPDIGVMVEEAHRYNEEINIKV